MQDLVPSKTPAGVDQAADAELAKVWKVMGQKMQQLANRSKTGYDENLSPEDVITNLNAVQAAAKEKEEKWGRIRQIFNTTLDAVSKVGGVVASAASNVSLIDVSHTRKTLWLTQDRSLHRQASATMPSTSSSSRTRATKACSRRSVTCSIDAMVSWDVCKLMSLQI